MYLLHSLWPYVTVFLGKQMIEKRIKGNYNLCDKESVLLKLIMHWVGNWDMKQEN